MSTIPTDSDNPLELDLPEQEPIRRTPGILHNRRKADRETTTAEGVQFDSQIAVYVLAFGGLIIYFVSVMLSHNKSWWISILFGLPVAAQVLGSLFHIRNHPKDHHYFYFYTMGLSNGCLFSYCFLWVWYDNDLGANTIMSAICLIIVAGLLFVIGCMMSAFMKRPRNPKSRLKKIRDGAAQEPLWAMSFLFFVIFLDVTYLFGFAFAFHDKYCLNTGAKFPALRMINYDSPDDPDAATPNGTVEPQKATGGDIQSSKTQPPAGVDTKFYFYFLSGQAQLDAGNAGSLDYVKCELPAPVVTQTSKGVEINSKPAATQISPPSRSKWLRDWFTSPDLQKDSSRKFNQLFNRCSLERLKLHLEEETIRGAQVRVVLIGQGDKQPILENGRKP